MCVCVCVSFLRVSSSVFVPPHFRSYASTQIELESASAKVRAGSGTGSGKAALDTSGMQCGGVAKTTAVFLN